MKAQSIIEELQLLANTDKAKVLSSFFKTGKGEYGEGDLFLGVPVPLQRSIAKRYQAVSWVVLDELLGNSYHEIRLTALLILVEQFTKNRDSEFRKSCIEFYLTHTHAINSWDLVDLTCYKLLGAWLGGTEREVLYRLANSANIWEQRIAIVSCMAFVLQGDFKDCLQIADLLLHHPNDLIQKAVGCLLREVGKKEKEVLVGFLDGRYRAMPRTMLRYAIEHFSKEERLKYLLK